MEEINKPLRDTSKPLFVISSPFDTFSGYGARSRDLIKSIIELDKYEVKLLAQRWGNTPWNFCKEHKEWSFLLDYIFPPEYQKIQPDIWMQITIPNEFQPTGKFNIGVTAGIEATLCKPEWLEGLNRMDVNWVSSNFTKETLEKVTYTKKRGEQVESVLKVTKPIHVIFEGANLEIYKPIPSKECGDINLDYIKEKNVFLFVGHWMQGDLGHDRKNVGLLIQQFYETFKNQKSPPALLLKTSRGPSSYISRDSILDSIRQIKEGIAGSTFPNIYLLNGEFTDSEINQLYNNPKIKAMVSLTKGEGFGRPLLEFSLVGKPIVASNWSGHLDFLNKEFVNLIYGDLEKIHPSAANQWLIPEAEWFKPNLNQFKDVLKSIIAYPKKHNENAKRQKYYAKTNFNWEKMKELVGETLEKSLKDVPKQTKLILPKLKKVN